MNLTLSEIAKKHNLSRQAVYLRIRSRKILPDSWIVSGGRRLFAYSEELQAQIMDTRKNGRPRKGSK